MSDPNVTFTKPEDLRPFKVPAETFWEIARFAGDGYDRADLARTRGWSAQYNWGQDGWDFLEPPYYMGYIRDTDDGFEFATNCEGDVDVWRFPTKDLRAQAIDLWAFLSWQHHRRPWVEGFTAENIPDNLRGPFRSPPCQNVSAAGTRKADKVDEDEDFCEHCKGPHSNVLCENCHGFRGECACGAM